MKTFNHFRLSFCLASVSALVIMWTFTLRQGPVEAQGASTSRDPATQGTPRAPRKPVGGKTAGAAAPTPPGKPANPGASTGAAAGDKAPPSDASSATAPEKGLVGRLVDFLVDHALWIVVAFAGGLGAIIFFMLRGGRSEDSAESVVDRHLLTPSPLAESEGPRRSLTPPAAAPAGPAIEREYALVVNQEDLKKPPLPQEAAPARRLADCGPIQELLAHENYDDAYRQYLERIEADGQASFLPELERRLGDHFLKSGDLEKAARVLEHHVATHAGDQIDAETYFNLGYIHFKGKTLNKSRRYFRLFVERQSDPALAARGLKLLSKLEKVQNLN
jgi:hypothetical protein